MYGLFVFRYQRWYISIRRVFAPQAKGESCLGVRDVARKEIGSV